MDPLAEYHFNMNPYHYVENNPISYIDPFGLDKKNREDRRNTRRNERADRRDKSDPVNPDQPFLIPEVTTTAKGEKVNHTNHVEEWQDDASAKGISFTTTQGGEQSNNRDSEVWLEIDSEFLDLFGLWMKRYNKQHFKPYERPTAKKMTERSVKGVGETPDVVIVNKNTGTTSEQTSPENQTIVITYSRVGKRNANIWKSILDYKGEVKDPVSASDTFMVTTKYSTNGILDSTVITTGGN